MQDDSDTDIRRDERGQFAIAGRELHPADDAGAKKESPRRRPDASRQFPRVRVRELILNLAERELARGAAFLIIPVLLGLGAVIYFSIPFEPRPASLAWAGLALLVVAMMARNRFWLRLAFFSMLVVLSGVAAGQFETWRAGTQMLGSDVTTRITGLITAIEARPGGRVRFTIDVAETDRPRLHYAPRQVRATARGNPAGLAVGNKITGLVRLMTPSGPTRPNGYDFAFASYFDGIGAFGFFLHPPERAEGETPSRSLRERIELYLERAREQLGAHIAETIGGPEGAVAAALIAGVRGGIPGNVEEDLRTAGLAHILSISGLHMALVAVTVMGVLRLVFAFFPAFSARLPVKQYAAGAAVLVSFCYLMMSGNDVAAQRSFIMLAVMLGALFFDRAALTMRNLAIAAIVVLAVSPHEVVGPSFQMSFAATAALIAAYAAWSEHRRGRPTTVPIERGAFRKLIATGAIYTVGLAFTSIVAGGATTIYAVWHFQRAAPLGLLGNLGAMPIMSTAVMPFAVLSVVLMPFGLDTLPLYVMGEGLAGVLSIAHWVSAHAPRDATGMVPPATVAIATLALLAACIPVTRLRLVALPLAVAAAALLMNRNLPTLLISEDARLVAMKNAEGRLAVNRPRPPAFETEDWLRAMAASDVAKPLRIETIDEARRMIQAGNRGRFICTKDICLARTQTDDVIAATSKPAVGQEVCDFVSLLVISDASARDTCRHQGPVVVTSWELARRGSAAVDFETIEGRPVAKISYAVGEPWRPWHTQRAWTRAARGLPPYRPPKKKPTPPPATAGATINSGGSIRSGAPAP